MIDKEKAIETFLENMDSLSRLPLITETEINGLYGEEVAAVLARLSSLDRKHGICAGCSERCCLITRCELYSPRFGRCPVHDFRPAVCRLHYCDKFSVTGEKDTIKLLGDLFFDGLAAAESRGSLLVGLFDSPPLAPGCPELVGTSSPWVQSVEKGEMDPDRALELIRPETEKHRIRVPG